MGETKAAQAYGQVETMLVTCALEPGEFVSESRLMELTGFGRTPVREALQRLARNRMVEIHPGRGVLVPPLSVESELRMLELRRALEVLAVRLASERADMALKQQMQKMIARLREDRFTLDGYLETVRDTHGLIARGAGNQYLVDAIAPVQGLSRRFWYRYAQDEAAEIKAGRALHLGILQAVCAGQPDAAESASLRLNDYLVEFTYRALRLNP